MTTISGTTDKFGQAPRWVCPAVNTKTWEHCSRERGHDSWHTSILLVEIDGQIKRVFNDWQDDG